MPASAEVERLRCLPAARKVYGEDLLRTSRGRQVDEEDFVEAPFAHEFRRQGVDVICRCDDEHLAISVPPSR